MDVNKKCGLDYNFTEIELIRIQAFDKVKKYALYAVCNAEYQSKLGRVVNNPYQDVNYLYYWIDYLTLIRNEIDRYIQLNGCISLEELNKIYSKYQTECIINKQICSLPLMREIFNLFKPTLGICENLVEWEWDNGVCEQGNTSVVWLWDDVYTCELY